MKNKPDKLDMQNEQIFEHLLEQDAGSLNPFEDVVPHITDWPQVKNQLFWGLMLNAVMLNFWNLQYILPTCGLVLLFLGLRELRRENRWFQLAWFANIAALICTGIQLTALGTIHAGQLIDGVSLMEALAEALSTVTLLLGLVEMRKKAGLLPWTRALKTVGVLYLLWIPLVLFLQNRSSTLLALPVFLILIIGLFSSLHITLRQMQGIGYTAHIAPKRLKDLPMGLLLLALLLIAVLCGMHFGQSYSMEWKPIESSNYLSAEELERLKQYGLYPDDLEALDFITQNILKNAETIRVNQVGYGSAPLKTTFIATKFQDGSKDWHVICLFKWTGENLSQGTAGLWIGSLPEYSAFRYDMPAYGGLRYQRDGNTYYGDFHKLEYDMVEQPTIQGSSQDLRILCSFSPPKDQDSYSGYIRFVATAPEDILAFSFESEFRKNTLLYPAYTAEDSLAGNLYSDDFYRSSDVTVFD